MTVITRRWLWLFVAVVAVAAGLIAGELARLSGPSVAADGPLARPQAAAIDALMSSSAVGRAYLLEALDDVKACTVTISTMSQIRAAAAARLDLLARVDEATVSDLPHGTTIKADLRGAVDGSYQADRAYLAWVEAAWARGAEQCPTHGDATWPAVDAANAVAGAAKRKLVGDWNPVATRYGLARRSTTII